MPIDWDDQIVIKKHKLVMRTCSGCGEKKYIAFAKANNYSKCAACSRQRTQIALKRNI